MQRTTYLWLGILASFGLSLSSSCTATEEVTNTTDTLLELNTLLDTTLKQTERIQSTLDVLNDLINMGGFKVEDPQATRSAISYLKEITNSVLHTSYIPIDTYKIGILLQINQRLTDHIDMSITYKLKNLHDFTLDTLPALRSSVSMLSLDDLALLALENDKKIDALLAHARNAGLNPLQQGYGALTNFVKNHKQTFSTAFKVALIGAGAVTLLMMLPSDILNKTGLHNTSLNSVRTNLIVPNPNEPSVPNILGILPTELGLRLNIWNIIGTSVVAGALTARDQVKHQLLKVHHALLGSTIKIKDPSNKEIIEGEIDQEMLTGLERILPLVENIVKAICYPHVYERQGAWLGKGFLFAGPSRTGKTLIAKYIAQRINEELTKLGKSQKAAFIEVQWTELMEVNGIQNVLERAHKEAPCVVFIDEIDTLGAQRDRRSTLLNELLTGMSGINNTNSTKNQVIFIAATNKPEHIDFALLQPGRFEVIPFTLPTFTQRKKYFENYIRRLALDPGSLNIDHLAHQTAGCSYGDLCLVINSAKFAAKTREESLGAKHLQEMINRKIRRINLEEMPLNTNEQEAIAIYQAAKALAHYELQSTHTVDAITIHPIERKPHEQNVWNKGDQAYIKKQKDPIKYGALFTYRSDELTLIETEEELIKQIKIRLAGHVALQLMLGTTLYNYRLEDKNKAYDLAKKVALNGYSEDKLSKEERIKYTQDTRALLVRCEHDIKELLQARLPLLRALTNQLKEQLLLTHEQIAELYKQYI